MNATVIAVGMAINPTGAFLGLACQFSTDIRQKSYSSPESYTGSVLGAIIGITYGPTIGAGISTAIGKSLEKMTVGLDEGWWGIVLDVGVMAEIFKCYGS